MAQKELVFKLKFVDENGAIVEKTAQNLDDINSSIKDLNKELENTDLGSDQWNDLAKDLGNAEDALEKTGEAITKTKNAQKGLGSQLAGAPGIVGQVVKSVQGLGMAFKALLANPVVLVISLIVAALAGLFKAFTSTKAGGELLDRVMVGIGTALDVLRDRVVLVGGAIIKFFSGDFSGAFEDVKGAVSGIGDEIAEEMRVAMEAKKMLQEVEDATRKLNVRRAEQNALISEAKQKINDENLSYEEREKALEQVRVAEIALSQQEEQLAKDRLAALQALDALSDSNKEQLDELAAAQIAVSNAIQATADKQKEIADQQKSLRDKRRSERKSRRAERKAAEAEAAAALQAYHDLENKLKADAIVDDEERALRGLEIQKESALRSIEEMKITEDQKKNLRELTETDTEAKIEEIKKTFKDKRDTEAAAEIEKNKADKQAEIDTYIALEEMKRDADGVLREEELANLEEFLNQKLEIELENLELSSDEKELITKQYEESITDIKKQNADAQGVILKKKTDQEIEAAQATANVLGAVAQAAGEATAIGKAAAIASTLINTYLSAQQIYTRVSETPGLGVFAVPLAVAGAAAAVVGGLKNVQQIMSVQPPTAEVSRPNLASGGMVRGIGSGTSDSIPANLSNGESVINARSTSAFGPLLSAINEAGGGASFTGGGSQSASAPSQELEALVNNGRQSQAPIKTYVVASDVSTVQSLDRQIKSRSTI